METVNKDKD